MMLIVLDSNPTLAGRKVPDKLKFKQLLELCQMICSCGYSDVYKKVNQGKEIQKWIKKNPAWVKTYADTLFNWCFENINMKDKTIEDLNSIIGDIEVAANTQDTVETAIFRYSKNYSSKFPSNAELDINTVIKEYKKYMEWKER